jgi:Tol biopolymer transport system component
MVEETPNHFVQRFSLWVGGLDGSQPRLLGEGMDPQLSPDGRWVAFSRDLDVYVVARTGGRPWLVARNTASKRWSQTSRYLAVFPEQNRVFEVIDMTTRERVTIDRGVSICGASFSPSGHELVWSRKRGKGCGAEGSVDVYRARVDGRERTRLTRDGRSSVPVWGPRGIAFTRARSSGDAHNPVDELWMMGRDGSSLRRLTRGSQHPVEWSTDGRRLLTLTYTRSSGTVSVVDVEAGDIHPVVRGKYIFGLALARDGRSVLAWVTTVSPHGNLVRVGLDRRRTVLVKDADPVANWNA